MDTKIYNVLFLCTGNSARSIMAECSLGRWGKGRFRAFSAGSRPTQPHPSDDHRAVAAVELFRPRGSRARAGTSSRRRIVRPCDFVFTVCSKAAGETCPLWPGQPMTAHWGIEDPASFVGSPSSR